MVAASSLSRLDCVRCQTDLQQLCPRASNLLEVDCYRLAPCTLQPVLVLPMLDCCCHVGQSSASPSEWQALRTCALSRWPLAGGTALRWMIKARCVSAAILLSLGCHNWPCTLPIYQAFAISHHWYHCASRAGIVVLVCV